MAGAAAWIFTTEWSHGRSRVRKRAKMLLRMTQMDSVSQSDGRLVPCPVSLYPVLTSRPVPASARARIVGSSCIVP